MLYCPSYIQIYTNTTPEITFRVDNFSGLKRHSTAIRLSGIIRKNSPMYIYNIIPIQI